MIHVGIWNRTSRHLILADRTISVALIVLKVVRYVHCICFVKLYGLIFFVISPDDCMNTPMSVLRNWGEIALCYNKEFAICRVASNFLACLECQTTSIILLLIYQCVLSSSHVHRELLQESQICPLFQSHFDLFLKQEPDSIHPFDMDEISEISSF